MSPIIITNSALLFTLPLDGPEWQFEMARSLTYIPTDQRTKLSKHTAFKSYSGFTQTETRISDVPDGFVCYYTSVMAAVRCQEFL